MNIICEYSYKKFVKEGIIYGKGKKVFSEEDKTLIKSKLKDECMVFWISQGYKETSIGALCKKAEISTGTFIIYIPVRKNFLKFCMTFKKLYMEISLSELNNALKSPALKQQ